MICPFIFGVVWLACYVQHAWRMIAPELIATYDSWLAGERSLV